MGRKAGKPAYKNKKVRGSYMMTPLAHLKVTSAVRRTGKSESDVLTHCILVAADTIGRDTPLVGQKGTFVRDEMPELVPA